MPASRRGSSTSLRGAACPPKLNERWRKRRSNPLFLSGAAWIASRNPVIGRAFARPVGSQRRGWGPSANTILPHCEELLRPSNPLFLCAAAWIASLRSQRRGWGPSANTILHHCEELLRRSNPYFLCGGMDCFAEPVIGRAFVRPVGSQ